MDEEEILQLLEIKKRLTKAISDDDELITDECKLYGKYYRELTIKNNFSPDAAVKITCSLIQQKK